jgi:hypothetical protein
MNTNEVRKGGEGRDSTFTSANALLACTSHLTSIASAAPVKQLVGTAVPGEAEIYLLQVNASLDIELGTINHVLKRALRLGSAS